NRQVRAGGGVERVRAGQRRVRRAVEAPSTHQVHRGADELDHRGEPGTREVRPVAPVAGDDVVDLPPRGGLAAEDVNLSRGRDRSRVVGPAPERVAGGPGVGGDVVDLEGGTGVVAPGDVDLPVQRGDRRLADPAGHLSQGLPSGRGGGEQRPGSGAADPATTTAAIASSVGAGGAAGGDEEDRYQTDPDSALA